LKIKSCGLYTSTPAIFQNSRTKWDIIYYPVGGSWIVRIYYILYYIFHDVYRWSWSIRFRNPRKISPEIRSGGRVGVWSWNHSIDSCMYNPTQLFTITIIFFNYYNIFIFMYVFADTFVNYKFIDTKIVEFGAIL
jgi:hypothetical protein